MEHAWKSNEFEALASWRLDEALVLFDGDIPE
jgi:hypothetical protein